MILKYFYDEELAQAAYLIGCAATGEALIIDAARDVQPYIDAAETEGLSITHITETHIHADYVSGSRELAARTGGKLYLSDMGDADWKYGIADEGILVRDGDMWMVGNIKVDVIHTPGHTLEHICFMITDTAAADKPIGIFTGDFLFVGNVGRPDLLEEAAGITGTAEPGARQQFKNIQRFKEMADYLQIWPGHGSGSACGKSLGSIPSTTLGYEKLFNPAFQFTDEDAFVQWLLDGQPEPPRYFAEMKRVNKVGPTLLKDVPYPKRLDDVNINQMLLDGAQIIDTRSVEDFSAAFVPGALNVPSSSGKFNTYAGWFIDFERPLYIVASQEQVDDIVRRLRRVGADNIAGYIVPETITGTDTIEQLTPEKLSARMEKNGLMVLDVRGTTEHEEVRIAGTKNIPMGFLPRHLDEMPRDKPIVTQCETGIRSQVAASLLRKYGFRQVANLDGGIEAWKQRGLPVEQQA